MRQTKGVWRRMDKGLVVEDSAPQTELQGQEAPVTAPQRTSGERPDPQWVRGRCPECGDDLVSNLYYIGGKGYLLVWECWGSLVEGSSCHYRKVL